MLRRFVKDTSSSDLTDGEPVNHITTNTTTRPPNNNNNNTRTAAEAPPPAPDDASVRDTLGDNSTVGTKASVRQYRLWRQKTVHLLDSTNAEQQHEQARRAGHLTAEHYWRLALNHTDAMSSRRELWHASFLCDMASVESGLEDEDPSSASFRNKSGSFRNSFSSQPSNKKMGENESLGDQSSERAMRRGMRRGKREDNEGKRSRNHHGGGSGSVVHDGMSLTHAETATSSPNSIKTGKGYFFVRNNHKRGDVRGSKKKNTKRLPYQPSNFLGDLNAYLGQEDEEDADAWMCGVCGKAFATLEAADKHEQDHIQRIVQNLPWMMAKKQQDEEEKDGSVRSSRSRQPVPPSMIRSIPLPSDLLDSYVLEDNENGERILVKDPLAVGNSKQVPKRLPSDLIEEVLEEEKQEIEEPAEMRPLDWPGDEVMMGDNTLVPRLRSEARFHQEDYYDPSNRSVPHRIEPREQAGEAGEPQEALLLSSAVRDYVILADEALVSVCDKARRMILSPEELAAERQLAYLSRDKAYYDDLARRAEYRKSPNHRDRHEGQGLMGKMQNKFLDAYQLMKEGTNKEGFRDEYNARTKKNASVQDQKLVVHNQKTLYLNVMVKNGIQVVKNELERLAQERWENAEEIDKYTRFERFRVYAHVNMVRLAGLALSSDFTPRRIAVQLSNDIYRLLTPRLKRRGVAIETEIEYRVGPYFVLAVNVLRIDWRKFLKATHRDVILRQDRWMASQEEENENEEPQKPLSAMKQWREYAIHILSLTRHDILAQILYFFYQNTHWLIYQPLCIICYYTFFGSLIRSFILSSVADEIFYYVEEKGMEMDIAIRKASLQAAFMLSALREIRADSKDHRQKQQQTASGDGKQNILGPLLGPAIPADKDVVDPPPGFEVPEHLEFLGLELDVPVGFRRLRWAFLSTESQFITEALYRVEAKYENITMGTWSKHGEYIGAPKHPDSVKDEDFIGAEKEASYLMPKSAFVKANMCTETHYILAYNDYCFTLKKKALTPEVPYGSTFVAWTQFTIINTGHESCRLQFSVEPEFPNGPPMVSRQIKSGMRAGVGELFVLIGETIAKYADEYP